MPSNFITNDGEVFLPVYVTLMLLLVAFQPKSREKTWQYLSQNMAKYRKANQYIHAMVYFRNS